MNKKEYVFDEDFDGFINDFGSPTPINPIDEIIIERHRSKLPEQIFKYWRALGACRFGNGLMWMTNPDDYTNLLDDWLSNSAFANRKDLSVIARTGFGELIVWAGGKGKIIVIDPHNSLILYASSKDTLTVSSERENVLMQYFWGGARPDDFDITDKNGKSIFSRLCKKLGVLKDDEIYGFKHRIGLGGEKTIDNMDIMKLEAYHNIAMQMEPPQVLAV